MSSRTSDMLLLLLLPLLFVNLEAKSQVLRSPGFPPVEFPIRDFFAAGDPCVLPYRIPGVCTGINNCREVIPNVHNTQKPVICCYYQNMPIVCCPRDRIISSSTDIPRYTTPSTDSQSEQTTSRYKLGERSRNACEENYKLLQYFENGTIDNNIFFGTGGKMVRPREFPHMALVGFGKEKKIFWRCSGALISSRFVLSAGHCVASRRHGAAKWILLGVVDPYDSTLPEDRQQFSIEDRVAHMGFKPPSLYDDISLLRLDRDAVFSAYVRPACLNTQAGLLKNFGSVPGWELVNWIITAGRSHLMAVSLPQLPAEECIQAYKSLPRLSHGYDPETMLCVGNKQGSTAVCERDTGGPYHKQTSEFPGNLHTIVAVTLLSNTVCGGAYSPVICVNVFKYLQWIEDTVWP